MRIREHSENFQLVVLGVVIALTFAFKNIFDNLFYALLLRAVERRFGLMEAELVAGFTSIFFPTIASIALVWFLYRYLQREIRAQYADHTKTGATTPLVTNLARAQTVPQAKLYLVNGADEWWVEVQGLSADAEYIASLDFSETTYRGFGRDPVLVQWSTKFSKDASKFIPAGGRARFFLYGTRGDHGLWKADFRFLRDGEINHGHSRFSWTDISRPPTPVHDSDKGVLKVIVSAKPSLRDGSMGARFAFDGHSVSIIEGEVQLLQ